MNIDSNLRGHIAASFTTLIWSTTFISTKILLEDFTPTEILFFRFICAYIVLFLLSPKPLIPNRDREELIYASAGLCGVTLYFLFQNIGLTYTLASNAGVLISVAPMLTAILAHFIKKGNVIHKFFIIGFVVSISGVTLISFNGSFILKLNPLGDILIMSGALAWAIYSNLLTLTKNESYTLIQKTRKIFFYGLLFMIPALFVFDFELGLSRFTEPINFSNFIYSGLFNILFLGLGASAICFLTWNYALGILGSVKAASYIYLSPVITIIFSAIVLKEPITLYSVIGTVLIIIGLAVSEKRGKAGSPNKEKQDEEIS